VIQPDVIGPLLEAIRHLAEANGVFFYRYERPAPLAMLAGWAGAPAPGAGLIQDPVIAAHSERQLPIVLHEAAWTDDRFAIFPEIHDRRVETLVSIPAIHDGSSVGLLNICRGDRSPLPAGDAATLFGLSLPMGALLAAGLEFARVSEQLADRKLLDRAKGILQARLAWTEEEAYLHLRRTSRRRRTALRDIAREVIARDDTRIWGERRAS
jgi:hypothetical protein